ncbi:MAG TPA: Arm DNA-binding domain-containing protein [Bacteroidales bacterium]|nr:Arm DNA-binding domain-containing protein [Bacteroidales bacterium]
MANYQTFSVRFYLKKHRLTQGEAPIYMRISLNAQKIDFSMHQRIDPDLWNDKMGRASGSVKKIRDLNLFLDSMKSTVTHHFITLRESTENFSLETLRNAFLGIKEEKKGPMVIGLAPYKSDNFING